MQAKKNEDLTVLGLARRAGKLVIGAEESRRAIRQGVARVVVLAEDAAEGQRAKVVATARGAGIPVVLASSRSTLGASIGKGRVTAVAVTDRGLGSKIVSRAGASRRGFRGRRDAEAQGDPAEKKRLVRRSRAQCG